MTWQERWRQLPEPVQMVLATVAKDIQKGMHARASKRGRQAQFGAHAAHECALALLDLYVKALHDERDVTRWER